MPESVVAVVPVVASVLGWLCELEIILVMRKGYGITCSVVVRGFTSIAFAVVIKFVNFPDKTPPTSEAAF